jgi:diguanylate cyclase (GGDEF)-like protein
MKGVMFLHQSQPGKQNFPLRLFAAAFIISMLTTAFSGWLLWQEYNRFEEMSRQHIALTGGVGQIMLFDESLTMSARLAASTGDFSYEKRYNQFDPQLTKEINDLRAMLPQKKIEGFVGETDKANVALVKMERQAFALTHQGRQQEAMALLTGDEYARFKKVYANGMQKTIRATKSLLDRDIQRLHFLSLVSATVSTAGVLVLFATWFFAARSTRHWAMERVESENMLREARDELEVRVKQRTADLGETNQRLSHEISDRKRMAETVQRSENMLNETGMMAKVGGWEFDMESQTQVWTKEVYRIHEVDASYEPTVSKGIEFYTPESRPVIEKAVQRAMEYDEPFDVELEIITAKGNHRWVHAQGKVDKERGRKKIVSGTFQDITERRHTEEKVLELAYHDSLTGLPNRKLFSDRLQIALSQRTQEMIGVAMLDLDKFKDVNDTLGHDVGDLLLKAATERLNSALRKGDTVARFGGDEFILILPGLKAIEDAVQIAQKIIDSFYKPFPISTHKLLVTMSIGIAIYPNDGPNEVMLLKNADIAMYQAKQAGRARYQIFKET